MDENQEPAASLAAKRAAMEKLAEEEIPNIADRLPPDPKPEDNPAYSEAKEAYDPINDHPDPAISGEPVYPDWVPEGPAFPTDLKEIDMAFGEMTDAKKALMADVKTLIYTRTKSPSLCIEMAFLLMGSTVKAVETGDQYSPENILALLMDNAHLWQGMLLRRVHEDVRTMAEGWRQSRQQSRQSEREKDARIAELERRLGKVPPQQDEPDEDGPDHELTGVK